MNNVQISKDTYALLQKVERCFAAIAPNLSDIGDAGQLAIAIDDYQTHLKNLTPDSGGLETSWEVANQLYEHMQLLSSMSGRVGQSRFKDMIDKEMHQVENIPEYTLARAIGGMKHAIGLVGEPTSFVEARKFLQTLQWKQSIEARYDGKLVAITDQFFDHYQSWAILEVLSKDSEEISPTIVHQMPTDLIPEDKTLIYASQKQVDALLR